MRNSRYTEFKYPDVRNSYSRAESVRSSRIIVGNNADSGIGESTPQDISSCCSSSADSTRPIRMVRLITIFNKKEKFHFEEERKMNDKKTIFNLVDAN